jgi:hypothetical protein
LAGFLFQEDEVLGDRLGISFGGEFGHTDAVGYEALVRRHPGVQFTEWLLEMCLDRTVEGIPVFTEDQRFKAIERSDGAMGLMLAGLLTGFTRVAMAVVISGTSEVADQDPHSA